MPEEESPDDDPWGTWEMLPRHLASEIDDKLF